MRRAGHVGLQMTPDAIGTSKAFPRTNALQETLEELTHIVLPIVGIIRMHITAMKRERWRTRARASHQEGLTRGEQ
jgi:hypothetical protein